MTTLKGKHGAGFRMNAELPLHQWGQPMSFANGSRGTEVRCCPEACVPSFSVSGTSGKGTGLRLGERAEPPSREISADCLIQASSEYSESWELLTTLLPFPPPQPSLGPTRRDTRQCLHYQSPETQVKAKAEHEALCPF